MRWRYKTSLMGEICITWVVKFKVLSQMEFMSLPQRGGMAGLTLSKSLPPFTITVSDTDIRLILCGLQRAFTNRNVFNLHTSLVHTVWLLSFTKPVPALKFNFSRTWGCQRLDMDGEHGAFQETQYMGPCPELRVQFLDV